MNNETYSRIFLGLVLAVSLGTSPALAQNYPSKRIRLVVPYVAGGNADLVARIVGQKLSGAIGQPVVVENRAGGASNIGSTLVAKSPPDGYTLLLGAPAHALNVSLYQKMPYDVLKDLDPVVLIGTFPNVLVIHPSLPARSVKELIALAKSRPSELTYGSGGNATSAHLSGELFKSLAGVNILHVPYGGGGAPVLTDLLGGYITMYFSALSSALPFVQNGRLRALGVTGEKRTVAAPQIPTVAEAGLPGYELVSWLAIFAPAGVPAPIIEQLNTEIVRLLNTPDTKSRLEGQGIDIAGGTAAEFGTFLRKQIEKYAGLVKTAGIRSD